MKTTMGSSPDFDQCFTLPGSDPKLAGEKRNGEEIGEEAQNMTKRLKPLDMESVEEKCYSQVDLSEGLSQVTEEHVTMNLNSSQDEITAKKTSMLLGDCNHTTMDLISGVSRVVNPMSRDTLSTEATGEISLLQRCQKTVSISCLSSTSVASDNNIEGGSRDIHNHSNFGYISESGSTTGPFKEKDAMKVWREMKQNGFLSAAGGGIPLPKQQPKKSRNVAAKKKIEIAKKEQVDRFAKMAAPSGLLNGLNPGIINHVRNSKQVHSIIKALTRSEGLENGHVFDAQSSRIKAGIEDTCERNINLQNVNDYRLYHHSLSGEDERKSTLMGKSETSGYSLFTKDFLSLSSRRQGDNAERREMNVRTRNLDSFGVRDRCILAPTLSSSTTKSSEDFRSISGDGSLSSVSSLSVNAATVASQWLELLRQDVRGRLAALQCSKKRVHDVIHTELPFLLSREFSSSEENNSCAAKSSIPESSKCKIADIHEERWSLMFRQMEKALSEEEKQLESQLKQITDMKQHCEGGLQQDQWNAPPWLQETSGNGLRREKLNDHERGLAINAAAASIYSTCNFLSSMENVSCF